MKYETKDMKSKKVVVSAFKGLLHSAWLQVGILIYMSEHPAKNVLCHN